MIQIRLSEPIPEEGRIPTRDEIAQFRRLRTNIRPTRSGAWTLYWNTSSDGSKQPRIKYLNKRTKQRTIWDFQIDDATPTQQPIPQKTTLSFNIISDDRTAPAMWFW